MGHVRVSIYGAVAAVIAVSGLSLYFRKARMAVEGRFKRRPKIDFHEVYKKNFVQHSIPEEKAHELWTEVANILELDSEKLLPTDRFDAELSPPNQLSFHSASNDFKFLLEKRCTAFAVQKESVETLGDYVIQFSRVLALMRT